MELCCLGIVFILLLVILLQTDILSNTCGCIGTIIVLGFIAWFVYATYQSNDWNRILNEFSIF